MEHESQGQSGMILWFYAAPKQFHPDVQLVHTRVEEGLFLFVYEDKALWLRLFPYFIPLFFSIGSSFGSAPRKFL